jgi:hypothetical protein
MYYLEALFGALLFNWWLFSREKNKFDKDGIPFDVKKYFRLNWDDIGFTILCAPVLVWYMSDIISIIRHWIYEDVPHLDIYYLCAGVLSQCIYIVFDKSASFISTLKKKS